GGGSFYGGDFSQTLLDCLPAEMDRERGSCGGLVCGCVGGCVCVCVCGEGVGWCDGAPQGGRPANGLIPGLAMPCLSARGSPTPKPQLPALRRHTNPPTSGHITFEECMCVFRFE